jgi:predicted ribosome quality control (RQC) complex YloA/Tae2 family protein
MACRKYLEGGRIQSLKQRGFDRILDILVISSHGEFILSTELMGKHSNILLLEGTERIIDAARRVTHKVNRFRQILPGQPYIAPPCPESRLDPLHLPPEEYSSMFTNFPQEEPLLAAHLMSRFQGFSPFLAREIAIRSLQDSPVRAWDDIFGRAAAGEWNPTSFRNTENVSLGVWPFPSVQFPPDSQSPCDKINAAMEEHYRYAISHHELAAAHRELEGGIRKSLQARQKQLEDIRRGILEANSADRFREDAELLLANIHHVEPEAQSIIVEDLYLGSGTFRTIKLDPLLSASENAEKLFRRFRKAKDSHDVLITQETRLESAVASLTEAMEKLQSLKSAADVKEFGKELSAAGLIREDRTAEQTFSSGGNAKPDPLVGKHIRKIHTHDGWIILFGENSEANDWLTGKIAKPDDIWLHVRSTTSAHVVIPTGKNPQRVPTAVLKQAAEIAAMHSAAKHSSMIPVDWTLKKYVRKPHGAPTGSVLYQKEKTIYVSPLKDGIP